MDDSRDVHPMINEKKEDKKEKIIGFGEVLEADHPVPNMRVELAMPCLTAT
jgi:hypothetical protein